MYREILFRGKMLRNREWVTGGYAESLYPDVACIVQIHNEVIGLSGHECIGVIASTVGQFTGLHDSIKWEDLSATDKNEWLRRRSEQEWNGKRIFEGDIVRFISDVYGGFSEYGAVVFMMKNQTIKELKGE